MDLVSGLVNVIINIPVQVIAALITVVGGAAGALLLAWYKSKKEKPNLEIRLVKPKNAYYFTVPQGETHKYIFMLYLSLNNIGKMNATITSCDLKVETYSSWASDMVPIAQFPLKGGKGSTNVRFINLNDYKEKIKSGEPKKVLIGFESRLADEPLSPLGTLNGTLIIKDGFGNPAKLNVEFTELPYDSSLEAIIKSVAGDQWVYGFYVASGNRSW